MRLPPAEPPENRYPHKIKRKISLYLALRSERNRVFYFHTYHP
jgi:hypothetical protein